MESTTSRSCIKLCLLPQRYLVAIMINMGIVVAYTLRGSQPIILKYITKPANDSKTAKTENWCNFSMTQRKEIHLKVDEYIDWDDETKSDITSCFFYGYLLGHFPGGYMADRYGGKHVFGLSILVPGLMTLIIPIIIQGTKNYVFLMVLRFVTGVVQGGLFPASNNLASNYIPKRERGRLGAIIFVSTQIGTLVNNLVTVEILKTGWPNVFYVYGGLAMLWWLFWMAFCYSNPIVNPCIGDKELRYLKKELKGHVRFGPKKNFPWKKMLSSLPVWALVVAQLGHTWVWHSFIYDLPNYMKQVLMFNVESSHLVASLPYGVMGFLTLLLGCISDFLINRNYVTANATRKISTTLGAMGPGIFVMAATFAGCSRLTSLYLFSIALGLMGFYYTGTRVIALDLAPNYSGCIMALANGLGAVPGVVQRHISHSVTAHSYIVEWRHLFLICLLTLAVTNMFFVLFGTCDEQPWNNLDTREEERPSLGRKSQRF